jgi:hypothetical protein
MQELSVYCGHLDVYQRAAEIIEKLLRVETSAATLWRISDHYGHQLQRLLYQPSEPLALASEEVIYAELDGSMIFTDQQWREVKLGRVFASQDIADGLGPSRGQAIAHSEYTAHLGGHEEFLVKFLTTTDKYAALGERLVFLSDGARWIEQAISQRYPDATQILDFYHVVEYLGAFAHVAIVDVEARQRWIAQQKALLLAGRVAEVIATVAHYRGSDAAIIKEQRERLVRYYRLNQERMRYDEYIRRGLYIGSGAIESAHRTVVQRRMKLSGQRWTNAGAEHMLNLRACSLSGKWALIENLIKYPAAVTA